MAGFRINYTQWAGKPGMKGFQITGKSGYTVSVQFGYGNYSTGRNDNTLGLDTWQETAETAVISPEGKFVPQKGEDVQGWQTPAQVAELIRKYID